MMRVDDTIITSHSNLLSEILFHSYIFICIYVSNENVLKISNTLRRDTAIVYVKISKLQ